MLQKEKLPHAGIEPATFRLLGGRSATKPMRLVRGHPAVKKNDQMCLSKDQSIQKKLLTNIKF